MKRALQKFLGWYQLISPSLHEFSRSFGYPIQCRYPLTCSNYAREKLQSERWVVVAVSKISLRFVMCSPIGALWDFCFERIRGKRHA